MFNYLFLAILTVPIKHLPIGSTVYVLEDNPNVSVYWVTDGMGNEFYVDKENVNTIEGDGEDEYGISNEFSDNV